jgi:hypothetical protein
LIDLNKPNFLLEHLDLTRCNIDTAAFNKLVEVLFLNNSRIKKLTLFWSFINLD